MNIAAHTDLTGRTRGGSENRPDGGESGAVAPGENKATRILLVEDEDRLLLGLTAVMRRAGYSVFTASNGVAGLQEARERLPDLIICDVMMPPPDGFELRSILAKDPTTASIPFIFLTARTGLEDRVRGIEGGADDYITKPFDRGELLARVQAVLRRNELGRQKGLAEAEGKVDQLRNRIMSGVSQEMKRPVASLLETLNNMLNARFAQNPDRLAEFVEVATDSTHQLESIIEDLMTLVSIDDGGAHCPRAPLDLDEAFSRPVNRCLDHWRRVELRDLDVDLRVDPAVNVRGDLRLFSRAVHHLVDNACKFSPEAGLVSIHLRANGDGGCELVVRDNGQGISATLGNKAFDRFVRGTQDVDRLYGGLGLGLTLARAIAKSHGGDVEHLADEPGCVMRLVLPACPREMAGIGN